MAVSERTRHKAGAVAERSARQGGRARGRPDGAHRPDREAAYKKRLQEHLKETRDTSVAWPPASRSSAASPPAAPACPRTQSHGRSGRQGRRRRQGSGRHRPRRGDRVRPRHTCATLRRSSARSTSRSRSTPGSRCSPRGRRPRDRPARQRNPARRGAHGQVFGCRAQAVGEGRREGRGTGQAAAQ